MSHQDGETCTPDEHLADLRAFFEKERTVARARLRAEGLPVCQVDQLMRYAERMHAEQLLRRATLIEGYSRFLHDEPSGRPLQ